MKFQPTLIPEVLCIEPTVYHDERGFFMESYQAEKFQEAGIPPFVQDNHSGSKQGVLRGLHYQIHCPQGKLVRVLAGEIFDVAVDLRRSSSTFARWVGVHLSSQNMRQLWIPAGFAHGFYVTSEWAEVAYKTTDFYVPGAERTLCWSDDTLNIQWPLPLGKPPIVSAKDAKGECLHRVELFS